MTACGVGDAHLIYGETRRSCRSWCFLSVRGFLVVRFLRLLRVINNVRGLSWDRLIVWGVVHSVQGWRLAEWRRMRVGFRRRRG